MYWLKINSSIATITVMLICSMSCVPDKVVEPTMGFSISQWMDSLFQTGIVDTIQSSATKVITVNELSPESKVLSNYLIINDLKDLKAMDFSSARWIDSYAITERDSGQWKIVEYNTENTKAPVDYYKGKYDGSGALRSIWIQKEKTSLVSSQNFDLQWDVDSGYKVMNKSRFLFLSPSVFKMEVSY